jgi:CRP/FNR family transcriptional regulator, cyclic AMP receptor protein
VTTAELVQRYRGPDGIRLLEDLICRQPFVRGDPVLAQKLAAASVIMAYELGEIIIQQGGHDNDLILILSGSAVVSPNGRDDTVRSAGSHVGEMALIDPAAERSATVRANKTTVVARISEGDFTRIANAFPSVWRHLAREMADRLRERVVKVPLRKPNARVFIASSREALSAAIELQSQLNSDPYEVKLWTDGIFVPGITNIEALEAELTRADLAILFLSQDDAVISRGSTTPAPRDNVIFELGLFTGALGRQRAIMVLPHGADLKIPTDLLGVNPIHYPTGTTLPSAMNAVAAAVRAHIRIIGAK